MKLLILLCLAFFAPFALAQSPEVVYNLPSWGASLLTFALALTLFTQAVKTRLSTRLERVPHYLIHGTTFALALGIAALIHSQGLLIDPLFSQFPAPVNWLLYGGLAGVAAVGGYDLLKSLLGLAGAKTTLPGPAPTAAQAEAQVGGLKNLTVGAVRGLAASFGIPPFVVNTILNENTLEQAWLTVQRMGAERALTLSENKDDQNAWAEANPVVVKPVRDDAKAGA